MKRYFNFDLDARRFFPLFIAFYVPWLVLEVLLVQQNLKVDAGAETSPAVILTGLAMSLALFLLTILFYIPILRKIIPAFSLDGTAFTFAGSIGKFLGLNLLGILLTMITAGIYGPWYIKRVSRYLIEEISFKEQKLQFVGKGGTLLVILLLTLVLPLVAVVLIVSRWAVRMYGSAANLNPFQSFMANALVLLIFLAFLCAYVYEIYRWYFNNLRYRHYCAHWNTTFWASLSTIWGQVLLSVITLGVYLPAAYIRLYRYFAERTEINIEDQKDGSFRFQGGTGRGFGLIWGQLLLSLVTLGLYTPWALAKVGSWYCSNTYFEPS